MTVTINAPEIVAKLSDGASAANLTLDAYTESVLRSALAVPDPSEQMPAPSAYYSFRVDKSPEARQAVLDVLRSFDDDDLEERRQSADYLRRALDEDRLSNRPLFPNTQGQPS